MSAPAARAECPCEAKNGPKTVPNQLPITRIRAFSAD